MIFYLIFYLCIMDVYIFILWNVETRTLNKIICVNIKRSEKVTV